jgi:response regulator RpfG family c-di-GMP phosphodiesterase
MNAKVLFVDDDPNLLAALQRQFRKSVEMDTAPSGLDGLKVIEQSGPFALVVSDMRMPVMDGIEFLKRVKALQPNTTRIMLTGNADQQTAIDAVNEGHIFRFLTKPCAPDILIAAVNAGIEQYRLVTAEAELLEKTLTGSIRLVMEILSLTDAASYGRSLKLRQLIKEVAAAMNQSSIWELELAATLSQIGRVALPAEVTTKLARGVTLRANEAELIARLPEISRNLLVKIPRLENVASIIYYQNKNYDGTGFPVDSVTGNEIPFGARLLKILTDLNGLESAGTDRLLAFRALCQHHRKYDPTIFAIAQKVLSPITKQDGTTVGAVEQQAIDRALREVRGNRRAPGTGDNATAPPPGFPRTIQELQPGETLAADITTSAGVVLLNADTVISHIDLEKVLAYARLYPIKQPVFVTKLSNEAAPIHTIRGEQAAA